MSNGDIGTESLCFGTTVLVKELRDWQNARDMTRCVSLPPCVCFSEELAHSVAGNEYFSTHTVAYVCVCVCCERFQVALC